MKDRTNRGTELPETEPTHEVPASFGVVVVGAIFFLLGIISGFTLMILAGVGILCVGVLGFVLWAARRSDYDRP